MGICVNMIVKNESANLPRLFKSLENIVDFYVICDTGSTDDTIEKIKELGKQYNIEGVVFSEDWKNFAYNRNVALNKAFQLYNEGVFKFNWILIIDADESLEGFSRDFLKSMDPNLTYKGYLKYKDYLTSQILFVSTLQQKWYWEGEIHNYLINNENYPITFNDQIIRNALHFKGSKSHQFNNTEQKSAYDVRILKKELNNSQISISNMHRFFQLANELFESKQLNEALLIYQNLVDNSDNREEIKFHSLLQIAHIYFEFLEDLNIAEEFYNKAMFLMPDRKEPYYYLVKLYQKKKDESIILDLLKKGLEIPLSNINK